jgi:iron complex outermembrane receptor protein
MQLRAHYRLNDDEFMLDRHNPDFYHNEHHNNSLGADLQLGLHSRFGLSSLGFELSRETIVSNNLGDHQRDKAGMFAEHQFQIQNLRLVLAGSLYNFSNWGWTAWPGIDIRYTVNKQVHFYGSAGKAFRIPTFTEMYYSSPTNQGNDQLQQEQAWIYELGTGIKASGFYVQFAGFQRNSKRLIDWIWSDNDSLWQVMNHSKITTRGLETHVDYQPHQAGLDWFVKRISLDYTYINSAKDLDKAVSKYALRYLRHQLQFGIEHSFFNPHLNLLWKMRYQDRLLYDDNFITDFRLFWKKNNWALQLDVTNLFDQAYQDYFDIPLPGRLIKVGVQFSSL